MTKKNNVDILYIGNRLSKHGSTPTNIDTLGPLLEAEGYRMRCASNKLNMFLRMTDMLSHIVRHSKNVRMVLIDTYSTNAFYFAWMSSWLCRMLRVPYVPILHGGNLPQRINDFPVLASQLFGNSYTNIVISGYLKQCLDHKGFKNQLIPNNIELTAYPFCQRRKIGPKLFWLRAFHKTYNPKMAIEVLAIVLKSYPDATLTMVGPEKDGSMAECKKLAGQLAITGNVSFTGKLSKSDWVTLSKQHDIFINTTDFDNLPVSVIEAMALGFPVVSTNVGGMPFLVSNGVDGVLTRVGDANEMSEAIIDLLRSEEKVSQMSLAARQKVEKFDWQIVRHKWHNLIDSLPN
ncbi:MAG: glycosyltransferase [Sphingobacteriales bacterium]|nr:MAG: glycosyltransferase [Sphingobacteriales bacterium]